MSNRQLYHSHFLDNAATDIAEMYQKFGFTLNFRPTHLSEDVMRQRHALIQEEVTELLTAIEEDNYEDMIDALVDIVVFTLGTAVMMGVRWGYHWKEVFRANMDKERGRNPKRPLHREDLIKPDGWKPPDHQRILEEYN